MRTNGQGAAHDARKAHRRVPLDQGARDDGRATQASSAILLTTAGLPSQCAYVPFFSSRHKDTKKTANPSF